MRVPSDEGGFPQHRAPVQLYRKLRCAGYFAGLLNYTGEFCEKVEPG